jgi:hypothetical protein
MKTFHNNHRNDKKMKTFQNNNRIGIQTKTPFYIKTEPNQSTLKRREEKPLIGGTTLLAEEGSEKGRVHVVNHGVFVFPIEKVCLITKMKP